MAGWEDVAVIVGGSAGALIGALFVAVSIKIDIIGRSTELRNRAAQALVLFGAPLTVSVLLAVPDQPVVALGGELYEDHGLGTVRPSLVLVSVHDRADQPGTAFRGGA
jgi:hypothetical protein